MFMKRAKGLALMVLAVALACGSFAHTARADECSGFNQAFAQNSASHQQDLLKAAMSASSQFPIVPAANQCLNNITSAMKLLPVIADPSGIALAAVQTILDTLMKQVCAKVMGSINSVSQGLTSSAKICIPMPKFNMDSSISSLGSKDNCDGATSYSLTTSSTSGSTTTNFLDYLK